MSAEFHRETERAEVLSTLARLPKNRREALIEEYRKRSEAAYAPSTLRNYKTIIAGFTEWCRGAGFLSAPPIEPLVVAEYIESLGGKLSVNTIETRLWAISELHRSHFHASPCRHRLVELALKGVKRKYGARTKQAPPLGKREVLKVVSRLGNTRAELRDKALIWTASDSWCRVSELVAFEVRDFLRQDDGSALLYVAKSKTDQFGFGDYAYVSPHAAQAVLAWIECANLKSKDPIFTKSQAGAQKKPLDPATVLRIFKRRFGRKDISTHSTRVGGVHDAFELGCSLSAIMVAGRWRSPEMPARYGRRIAASQSAAAEVARAFSDALPPRESTNNQDPKAHVL